MSPLSYCCHGYRCTHLIPGRFILHRHCPILYYPLAVVTYFPTCRNRCKYIFYRTAFILTYWLIGWKYNLLTFVSCDQEDKNPMRITRYDLCRVYGVSCPVRPSSAQCSQSDILNILACRPLPVQRDDPLIYNQHIQIMAPPPLRRRSRPSRKVHPHWFKLPRRSYHASNVHASVWGYTLMFGTRVLRSPVILFSQKSCLFCCQTCWCSRSCDVLCLRRCKRCIEKTP